MNRCSIVLYWYESILLGDIRINKVVNYLFILCHTSIDSILLIVFLLFLFLIANLLKLFFASSIIIMIIHLL